MNIIIDSNNLGIFLNADVTLTNEGVLFSDGGINSNYNTSNASTIEADQPSPPIDFVWQWNGSSWVVYNQEALDAYQESIDKLQAQANKATATKLLSATDWTTIADVGNPQASNPYLANQAAFIAYRNAVRQYAVYPTPGVIDWPTPPTEVWTKV